MKTIGILGGMSWESSVEYERLINTEIRQRLGGSASGDLILRSYDFAMIEELQETGRWDALGTLLADDAASLERAGADIVLLATNTMHVVADAIVEAIDVPFLHIGDVTAAAIRDAGVDRVALLGTRYTMEQGFYRDRLAAAGVESIIPDPGGRAEIHRIIYDELVRGIVDDQSRSLALGIIDDLVADGAEGVVAGCTEIELLVTPAHVTVPYFPTTYLHAMAAVDLAID